MLKWLLRAARGAMEGGITETVEGATRLLVPAASLTAAVPPREPAFYNPRARRNRDVSVLACAALARARRGEALVLEALAGLGARGVRLANESGGDVRAVLNDLNAAALGLAGRSADLNGCGGRVEATSEEACRFLSARARAGERGALVDVDPFGSPARYLDCAIRATAHGGMLSVTATDLQVLHGLFPAACARHYGGVPIRRTPHARETALRLVAGCAVAVGARLDTTLEPAFCESDMHYYRVYFRVRSRPDTRGGLGRVFHCGACGRRGVLGGRAACECGAAPPVAGPLWAGPLFDAPFAAAMRAECAGRRAGASCARLPARAEAEAAMPACYYTVDEVASRARSSPPRLARLIERLRRAGHGASPTSLDPTGFRTTAAMPEILECA